MSWYQTFDDTFWLTIGGMMVGLAGLVIRSCYRSKCEDISLCCLKIHRNVQAEIEEDRLQGIDGEEEAKV